MSKKPLPHTEISPTLASFPALPEAEALRHYLQRSTSENTRKTYRSALRQFEKWGGRLPTDRDTLVRYLLNRAQTLNTRSLDLHLTAISQWHQHQGMHDPVQDPLIRKTMEGIRRVHGQPKRKATALRLEHIVQLLDHLQKQPRSLATVRDQALILVGYFGAFRRSELVALQVDDLVWEPEGLLVRLSRSKTDQLASGMTRALPWGPDNLCPVKALRDWLKLANLSAGPVFRPINRWGQIRMTPLNPSAINDVLKRLGNEVGFTFVPELSSHSLRRGLSTSAARAKVPFELIKKQGGWKNDATVWGYIEEGQPFTDNAAKALMETLTAVQKIKG